ncbi:metal-sulfur cluster assembly factor [Streptomyces sp. BI20]|uniref:metal-sulfur cluster assembly factor n=1 Tax=Streptomyces sp. BI20 TaxID=3403460 RepID=UPI003C7508C6
MTTENAAPEATEEAAAPEAAPAAEAAPVTGLKPATEEEVREALYDVVDPELGIDVVNLGLIYGIHIDDANIATLDMTLTSAACPLTDVIEDQAKSATEGIVNELRINWVWMPPWGPDKITDDGREQLRALGFNV